MELIIIGIWIAMAVATGYIADGKGRNAIGWGIFGFFFGIFALIIVAVIGPSEAELDKRYNRNQ